jgi:hypothetical protein
MTFRPSRRLVMYGLVAAQLLVLAAIIAPQALNMALDHGPSVDIEVVHARGAKDPFRGAYVSGQSALDLDVSTAPLPAGLRGGDRVVVVFGVQPGRRPHVIAVQRGRQAKPFTATSFTILGRVVDDREPMSYRRRDGRVIAYVGKPAVSIDLDLPASIAVDDAALGRFSGPSIVRASLHAGYLGHRYFTDVQLTGRAWPSDVRFAYDNARERLVVFAARERMVMHGPSSAEAPLRSDLFVFDAAGKELSAAEVEGRVVDGTVDANGQVLALITSERWGQSEVSLVRLGDDGQSLQRGPPIAFERVLSFDAATGGLWIVAAPTSRPPQPPVFIQRATVAGLREPRLGPFDTMPKAVISVGDDVWVVQSDRHRITRLDAASGRVVREYRDLNAPVELAVDGHTLYVIEANRTQLTAIAEDGRILWRVPRFQGLTWAAPDPVTGGGWLAASTFEGAPAPLVRFSREGAITRVPTAARPLARGDWRRHVGGDVVRARDGRLFFLEHEAIVILTPDGASATRVVGFRFPSGQRLRS